MGDDSVLPLATRGWVASLLHEEVSLSDASRAKNTPEVEVPARFLKTQVYKGARDW